MTKALILAAGLGSRLEKNTKNIPKALVKVNGKPILDYQLNALKNQKIENLVIVLGYHGHLIRDYIKNNFFDNFNVQFVSNDIYDKSNSSYSFWLAKNFLANQDYIHLNCDIIFSDKLLNRVINSKFANIITTRSDLELKDQMENVIIQDSRIINMSLKNTPDANGKAFGLAKFSPLSTSLLIKKLSYFINKNDLNQNYYGMIRSACKEIDYFACESSEDNILEVNTVEDLKKAEQLLKTKFN